MSRGAQHLAKERAAAEEERVHECIDKPDADTKQEIEGYNP